jgi:hypothetical protein
MTLILFFCFSHLQKYIEEKVGPNEQISWAEQHIEKGFAGKLSLSFQCYLSEGWVEFIH